MRLILTVIPRQKLGNQWAEGATKEHVAVHCGTLFPSLSSAHAELIPAC